MKRDPYQVLGVDRNSPKEAIRRAFRRRAQRHHPDRGGDPAAMAEINRAYALLTDDAARERFDRTGEDGPQKSLDARARGAAMDCMNQLLEQAPDQVDLAEALRASLGHARNQAKGQVSELRGRLRKIEKRRKRLKDGGLFEALIAEKLSAISRGIAAGEEQIEILTRALDLVAQCRYEDDPEQAKQLLFGSGVWITGTSA